MHVAPQRVEEGNRIHFVDGLANPIRVSQFAMGSGASVGGRHACFDVAVRLYLEVRLEFGSPFSVPVFAAEETYETHVFGSECLLDCRAENASNRCYQLIPPIGSEPGVVFFPLASAGNSGPGDCFPSFPRTQRSNPDPRADGALDKAIRVRPEERLLNDARWNTRSCDHVPGQQRESVK